jgi:hypothetical protein
LKWWFADLVGKTDAIRACRDSTESSPDLAVHDCFSKVAPDVTGLSTDALLELIQSPTLFRFSVVRNPYNRVFSAWQSKLLLREPLQSKPYLNCSFFNQPLSNAQDIARAFEGFLEHITAQKTRRPDGHWAPQAIVLRPDLISYTKIAKVEELQELEHELGEHLGPAMPAAFSAYRTNESLIPFLSDFVTARSAELIRRFFAEDFEVFGYNVQTPVSTQDFSSSQLDVALRAVDMIRARHQRIRELRSWMTDEIEGYAAKLEQLSGIARNRKSLSDTRELALTNARNELDAVYDSTSWRITKPIRWLRNVMSRQGVRVPELPKSPFQSELIKVVIVTRNSARWLGAVIDSYRNVGIEPFFLLDGFSEDATERLLEQKSATYTKIFPEFARVEAAIRLIPEHVRSRWVIRIDDDEFPSRTLLNWIEDHLADIGCNVVGIPRRWVKLAKSGRCEYSNHPM